MGHIYRLGVRGGRRYLFSEMPALSELVDVQSQLRFQVAGFVFVDNIFLGQLVEHRRNFYIQCGSLVFLSHGAQFAHGITGGLGIVSVAQVSGLRLSDSLDG